MSAESIDFKPLAGLAHGIWRELQDAHAHLGVCHGPAARYVRDVSIFAGLEDFSPPSFAALAEITDAGEICALPGLEVLPPGVPFTIAAEIPVRQMVATAMVPASPVALEPLNDEHAAQMLALAEMTDPGPFSLHTGRMGDYVGVFQDGRLAAMGGERLRAGRFHEVSAICTHPDYRGHGYARDIVSLLTSNIQQRGMIPFLHVRVGSPSEQGAAGLYQHLGFEEVRRYTLKMVVRS